MTRADKFEEIFGYRPATDQVLCNEHDRCGESNACNYCIGNPNDIGREEDWWNAEYKEPTHKNDLSSGTRKNSKKLENVSPIIDWNNCHTSEQLDSIATTKNDLGVDAVSRQAVDRLVWKYLRKETDDNIAFYEHFLELPSVTPQESRKGHWIETKDISTNRRGQIVHEVICSECSGIAYFRSMGNKYIGANLCPNCGADMKEVEE